MSSRTKESRKLKDLIRIGVFSALWIVVAFLVAFTIGFFPPVLLVMPCILGLIGGIIYSVMLSKLTIPGGIIISSILLGLCLFTMAPYGLMCICTVIGGIIGEILYALLKDKTKVASAIGASCALVGLGLGEYIPFIWLQSAFKTLLESETSGTAEIGGWCMEIINPGIMLLLCAITVALTFLGSMWGRKIMKKRMDTNI